MELSEIKQRQLDLVGKLSRFINSFERETGTKASHTELDRATPVQAISDSAPRRSEPVVRLTVEI